MNFEMAILVSVYDRPNKLQACLASLENCVGVNEVDLVISSDGPKTEKDKENVMAVREIIAKTGGFRNKITFYKDDNSGGQVIQEARKYALSNYDCHIRLEDDNEVSNDFLCFMRQGLLKAKDNDSVIAVCGYGYPGMSAFDEAESNSYYYLTGYSAWGSGFWNNKVRWFYEMSEADKRVAVYQMLQHGWFRSLAQAYGHHYVKGLVRFVYKGGVAGDRFFAATAFTTGGVCLFPRTSRVRNTGSDGSGINCKPGEFGRKFDSKDMSLVVPDCYQLKPLSLSENELLRELFREPLLKRLVVEALVLLLPVWRWLVRPFG